MGCSIIEAFLLQWASPYGVRGVLLQVYQTPYLMKWLYGKHITVLLAKPCHLVELCIACSCLGFWVVFVVWGFFKALKDDEKCVSSISHNSLILNRGKQWDLSLILSVLNPEGAAPAVIRL